MIRRGIVGVVLFAGMVAITAGLWRVTPGSLVPDEDQGWFFSAVILPDGASLQRTDKVAREVEAAIRSNSANAHIISFTGFDFLGGGFRNNAASIFVTQIPWDERKVTVPQLVGEVYAKTGGIKEALVLAFNPPPIFGLGTAGGYELYLQNRGEGGPKRMNEVMGTLLQRAELGQGARLRADAVARERPAALRRRRPREGEEDRACRSATSSTRCRPRLATTTSTTSTSTVAPGRC